jgi:hypothetical protein
LAIIVYHASMVRSLIVALAASALLCGADDLSVRYGIPGARQRFGTVTVQRYDAISEKSNRTEFIFESPLTLTCVHSLFPHLGYQPCWYLSRHTEQRINY